MGEKQRRSRWRTKPDKATALVICLTRVNGGQPQRQYLQDDTTAGGIAISDQLHQAGLKFAAQVAACLEHRQVQASQEPPLRLLDTEECDSGWTLVECKERLTRKPLQAWSGDNGRF